jgi:sterol desaturase/sphingolipid hydroxylase (fatty acid hydroxylase superfamily)
MLTSHLEQFIIQVSTPFYAIIILGEVLLSNAQDRNYYTWKDTFTNVYLMLLNAGVDLMFRVVSWSILLYFYQYKIITIENVFLYWFVLFIAEDFLYFLLHYVDHYSRLFWAVHVTHHSSEYFNLSTGFRSSVFQPLYRFIYFIPLALIGFSPADIAIMFSITQIYGILVHTSYIKKFKTYPWKFLEYIFVTPSHHRVHHGSNVEYLDKNMGMTLIIWDKIFGTYQEEIDDLPIQYGLVTKVENPGPVNIVFHEWKKILQDLKKPVPFMTKLKYIFMPPGWSHDGSTLTAEQMRRKK